MKAKQMEVQDADTISRLTYLSYLAGLMAGLIGVVAKLVRAAVTSRGDKRAQIQAQAKRGRGRLYDLYLRRKWQVDEDRVLLAVRAANGHNL